MANKEFKFILAAVALALLLYFSYAFFLAPLPLVYVLLKRDHRSFILTTLACLLAVTGLYLWGLDFLTPVTEKLPEFRMLVSVPYLGLVTLDAKIAVIVFGIGNFVLYAASAGLIWRMLTRPDALFRYACYAIAAVFAVGMIATAILVLPNTGEIIAALKAPVLQGIEELAKDYDSGMTVLEISKIKDGIEGSIKIFILALPSIALLSFALLYWLNLMLSRRLFGHLVPEPLRRPLTTYRVPFVFVWPVIFALAFYLFNNQALHRDGLEFISMNTLFACGLLFFFQGIAIIFHFLDAKRIAGLFRLFVYFILFRFFMDPAYFLPTLLVIMGLGFFDSWIDNRKLDANQAALKS